LSNYFNIQDFKISSLDSYNFVKPVKLNYTQNGVKKSWEAVKSFDSVAILLYHKSKDSFILVKQFRAPVYMHNSDYSYTYELCAGIVDKDKSLEIIVSEECSEECGYRVDISKIEKITSFFTNVGVSGSKQHLFFAIVDNEDLVGVGGGINDEVIEVDYLKVDDAKEFIYDESKAKTPGLMFAFYWFFKRYSRF
jgi:UDP-sugar diphosphatase